jgi:type II secretory pathway pseudopilin PulG
MGQILPTADSNKLKAPRATRASFGFTVLEVLVVIAMIGAVAVLAVPFLSSGLSSNDASIASAEASDALREAQAAVMSGKENARFGVHFEGSKFVLFKGAAYNGADPDNAAHQLTGRVTATAVTLSPGGACTLPAGTGNCDVHFASRKGIPTETGSITFTGSGGETQTVTINAAGMIDVN